MPFWRRQEKKDANIVQQEQKQEKKPEQTEENLSMASVARAGAEPLIASLQIIKGYLPVDSTNETSLKIRKAVDGIIGYLQENSAMVIDLSSIDLLLNKMLGLIKSAVSDGRLELARKLLEDFLMYIKTYRKAHVETDEVQKILEIQQRVEMLDMKVSRWEWKVQLEKLADQKAGLEEEEQKETQNYKKLRKEWKQIKKDSPEIVERLDEFSANMVPKNDPDFTILGEISDFTMSLLNKKDYIDKLADAKNFISSQMNQAEKQLNQLETMIMQSVNGISPELIHAQEKFQNRFEDMLIKIADQTRILSDLEKKYKAAWDAYLKDPDRIREMIRKNKEFRELMRAEDLREQRKEKLEEEKMRRQEEEKQEEVQEEKKLLTY